MSEYYDNGYTRHTSDGKKKRGGIVLRIIDIIAAAASVATLAAMVCTLVSPTVSPVKSGFLALTGLVAPFLYAIQVLLTLYWIMRWKWIPASVMILVTAIGMFHISLFFKYDAMRTYGEPSYDRSLIKVMTYNVRGFCDDEGQSSIDSVSALIREFNPDIICLQEANILGYSRERFDSIFAGYRRGTPSSPRSGVWSADIYTKFRVIRSGQVAGMPEGRSLWNDIIIDDDTVRVFSLHLHTTSITADDSEYIVQHEFVSDTSRHKLRSIVSRLRTNSQLRAAEADSVAAALAATPYPVIVCGDWNDPPMSYAYRRIARPLEDAFRVAGKGYAHTFRGFYNTLRIDNVLYSDRFEAVSYDVPDVVWSDHLPVEVRLRYSREE